MVVGVLPRTTLSAVIIEEGTAGHDLDAALRGFHAGSNSNCHLSEKPFGH